MFLINGKPGDSVSVQDRGLHYGDGVFETIAVYQDELLCWDKHYERLKLGCQRLDIPCPDQQLLLDESRQLLADKKAVIKIIITRGAGGRGYNPHGEFSPNRIVADYPWPDYPDKLTIDGIKARTCSQRLSDNPELAGIKHLNRLEQVLARNEWNDTEIYEGLMMDQEGNIIEGTMSNIFIINGKELVTPDLYRCGIHGIIRQCIIDLAPGLEMNIEIRNVKADELSAADEIFLCNSTFGIWPVCELDGKQISTGTHTQKIKQALINHGYICA